MRDPSGAGIGLRIAWLAGSPLPDYRIPGALLFGVIGVGSAVLAAWMLRRPAKAALASAALGGFLMAWIVAQVFWLEPFSWLQPFIFSLGLFQVLCSAAIWRQSHPQKALEAAHER